MEACYHSGLEGYCKAATQLLGDSANRSNWLPLCREILCDRTIDTLPRAWKLSNQRRGRSNRLILFENCWLGTSYKTYIAEAHSYCKRVKTPADGYRTIRKGSDYAVELLNARNDREREQAAMRQCESDAIDACVNHLIALDSSDDDIEGQSPLACLVRSQTFAVDFYTYVIASIEQGFYAERYEETDVRQFSDNLNNLLEAAQRGLQAPKADYEPLRRLAKALFAGLVYGPGHPIATDNRPNATSTYYASEGEQVVASTSIRLTQVFGNDLLQTGMSKICDETDVVFVGRGSDEELFVQECGKALGQDMQRRAEKSDKILFGIHDIHEFVGNYHGMLMCEGGTWWYYDINAHNGTSIQSKERVFEVVRTAKILAGDLIRLGVPADAKDNDMNVYNAGAVLYVTQHIDEGRELYR